MPQCRFFATSNCKSHFARRQRFAFAWFIGGCFGLFAKCLEPPIFALLMSANSSATAFFQILNDNNGAGLMFETEGDTLAQIV
jgi:hypothetical protein